MIMRTRIPIFRLRFFGFPPDFSHPDIRYRDEHVRALWFADRQAMTNCSRLVLDWGPDPGQKRLAVAYLRLRRLLDVSDRKEHTNLSFISNFSEVRAR